jgi:hypothetical protein
MCRSLWRFEVPCALTLMSPLQVAYVDSNKKGEVLQLMARMMVRYDFYSTCCVGFGSSAYLHVLSRTSRRNKSAALAWATPLKATAVVASSRPLLGLWLQAKGSALPLTRQRSKARVLRTCGRSSCSTRQPPKVYFQPSLINKKMCQTSRDPQE